MAEGRARRLSHGKINVMSAGIEAHGNNPRVIAVMAEAGVDISEQESTRATPALLEHGGYRNHHLRACRQALPRASVTS
jgi:arsenate reductase